MDFDTLLENFGVMKKEKRLFYPRNFNLSEAFLNALKREMKLQDQKGVPPEQFTNKLNRAMQFYVEDYKRQKNNKNS